MQRATLFLLLSLLAGAAFGYHEANEPSDGTVHSFKATKPKLVPPIEFLNAAGEEITLGDYRGKLVLVNIWATWCSPCLRELPGLDRLQQRMGKTRFQVVPVSIDAEGLPIATAFFQRLKIESLDLFADPAKALGEFFAVDVLPASYIIDPQGRVISYLRSFIDWDDPAAQVMLDDLLRYTPGITADQ